MLHIEDIEIPPGNGNGMNIQDGSKDFELSDVRIRRCIVYGRYEAPGTGGRRQGLYAHQTADLEAYEQCVEDWKSLHQP